jgi:hypothetical protein
MLFVAHNREVVSVDPPALVMRLLAFTGRLMGYKLPP